MKIFSGKIMPLIILLAVILLLCASCVKAPPVATEQNAAPTVSPAAAVVTVELAKPTPSPDPPTPEPTPVPTPEAELTPEPSDESYDLPLKGYVIGIDPGHQAKENPELEPESPGSKTMKAKVAAGTRGRFSNVPEYEVTLAVGLLLKDLLTEQGASVVMTRETNDVDISNIERAEIFNGNKTDYALRLHCNGDEDSQVHGAFILVPESNPYAIDCNRAARILIDAYCESTGAKNLGVTVRGDQTGFNWCERMIINIEMGHMTNKGEDLLLTDADYQVKMAKGLCDGILEYFQQDDS